MSAGHDTGGWGTAHSTTTGMTLRDYIAAKALPAVLSELWARARQEGRPYEVNVAKVAAQFAYETADEVLKARSA